MKNKIPYVIAVALAATIIAGCQRQPENNSNTPPVENPPGAPANTNSTGPTNLSQANAPAASDSGNPNNPVSTNQ